MLQSKRGAKALGLCALALGLIALYTSASQAEKGANWKINGANVTEGLLPTVLLSEVLNKDMILLTKVAGQKVELLCTKAQFIGAKLETEGKVAAGNKTKFEGCVMRINGTISEACKPGGTGSFESNTLKGLLVLHELGSGVKDTLILFEPVVGTAFVTIKLGEECAIGESCTISGVSTVKDAENKFGVEAVEHIVEQGPLSKLWINTDTPEHAATIDGAAKLALSGAHAGMKWSGTPG
jgi:hypothetical protein